MNIYQNKRYVKNGEKQSIETIFMTIKELLDFLRDIQKVIR